MNPTLPGMPKRARLKRPFKIKGPSEHDIQSMILACLGTERKVLKQTKAGPRWVGTGIYVALDGSMFWRQNSGATKIANRFLRSAPAGTADIIGVVKSEQCGGVPVALEVKTETGRQEPSQKTWEAMWTAAGGVYAIVRSPNEAMAVVNRIRREAA